MQDLLSSEAFKNFTSLFNPLFTVLISAVVSMWISRRTIENTNEATPPALKRLEISANIYHQAKNSDDSEVLVEHLLEDYNYAADAARWEKEVLKETPYQSEIQKNLLKVPYAAVMKQKITHMPYFGPSLFLEGLFALLNFTLYIFGPLMLLEISWMAFYQQISFLIFLILLAAILIILVLPPFLRSGISNDCKTHESQQEYVRILSSCFNREVAIEENDGMRQHRLEAAILNPEVRRTCNFRRLQASSNGDSFVDLFKNLFVCLCVMYVRFMKLCNFEKPLRTLAGPSPYVAPGA